MIPLEAPEMQTGLPPNQRRKSLLSIAVILYGMLWIITAFRGKAYVATRQ